VTAVDGRTDRTGRSRRDLLGRVLVRVVFALLIAYMVVQSVGNTVTIAGKVDEFNTFVASAGGSGLQRSVPWVWLVLDIVVGPVAYAVAWWTTRRARVAVTAAVFLVAFAAAGALWLDLQLFVPRLIDL
jgi:zinc transporter ZupT